MATQSEDFSVGWICAIPTEYVVACELLGEEYTEDKAPKVNSKRDNNSYTFGRIHEHNVVIACLPKGRYGTTSAAIVAEHMLSSFPCIKFGLLVGIAGGAPSERHDIRLGDVVVGSRVIQYDFGKAIENHEFEETGHLAPSPDILLNAIAKMDMQHIRRGNRIAETVTNMIDSNKRLRKQYSCPGSDKLYKLSSDNSEHLVTRPERDTDEDDPLIHYGLVASANRLMKDRKARDALIAKYDVLCFEMEAAGLMDSFPCVVIRGICDYSDPYKNDDWQGYAAATAAAYTKELLEIIPGQEIESMQPVTENAMSSKTSSAMPIPTGSSINDFRSSTNHGIQAHAIHGGIHQYHYQSTGTPLQTGNDKLTEREVIDQADLSIRQYYTSSGRLDIERLSGEKLPLEQCYINLTLVDQSSQKTNKKSTFSVEARLRIEGQKTSDSVTLENLFEPRKLSAGMGIPRRIFIQGRAGVGKTTLCKKLVYEFLQGNLAKDLFDRLLWIPLRRLKSKKQYQWKDLLQDAHFLRYREWDQVIEAYAHHFNDSMFLSRTLLLFDGLDEISQSWRHDDELYELLENIVCDSPNIIITSRPQAKYFNVGKFDLELETTGFLPHQINAYLSNCAPPSQLADMKLFIRGRPLIQGLLRIPIQLDAFCCTWPSNENDPHGAFEANGLDRDSISTMTTLYQSISSELCKKDIARMGRARLEGAYQPRSLQNFEVDRFLENELKFLGELAFQGMVSNIIDFTPSYQDRIGSYASHNGLHLAIPYSSVLEGMSFLRSSDIEQDPSKRTYHFIHLTFQEFFAAKHFATYWQKDTPLICLQQKSHERKVIPPFSFLQREKYNPRYNIFWRFVTGLVQMQSWNPDADNEQNAAVRFFDQLHAEPIDLFGTAHYRLVMYCLSELVSDDNHCIRRLRRRQEDLLSEAIKKEYQAINRLPLGKEVEFPEDVLCSFLKNEQIPQLVTLTALANRSYVGREAPKIVSDLIIDNSATHVQLKAIQVVLKNWQTASWDIVAKATKATCEMLMHADGRVRWNTISEMYQWSFGKYMFWPKEIVDTLITIFKDEHLHLGNWWMMIDILRNLPLSREAVDTLMMMLEENSSNPDLAGHVAFVLAGQSPPSTKVIKALIATVLDEGMGSTPDRRLGYKRLPEEAIDILIDKVRENGRYPGSASTRKSAALTLRSQRSLPQQAVDALITALSDDTSSSVRSSAAAGLRWQSYSSCEVTNALIKALQDEDCAVRRDAALSLAGASHIPRDGIIGLIHTLGDEELCVQEAAANALADQSHLHPEATTALANLFRNRSTVFNGRNCAVTALSKDTISTPEAITDLVTGLGNQRHAMRSVAIRALGKQALLSRYAVTALVNAVDDRDTANQADQWEIISVLHSVFIHGQHFSLPKEAISNFIAKLAKNCSGRDRTYSFLHECNIYSKITELSRQDWQRLWSFWVSASFDEEFCCYELGGSLYIWAKGGYYEISNNAARTRELLDVVLAPDIKEEKKQLETVVDQTDEQVGEQSLPKHDMPEQRHHGFKNLIRKIIKSDDLDGNKNPEH